VVGVFNSGDEIAGFTQEYWQRHGEGSHIAPYVIVPSDAQLHTFKETGKSNDWALIFPFRKR